MSDFASGVIGGFQIPWMSLKTIGETEEVPLEVKLAAPRQSLVGASWGRQMSNQPTSQGGGAIMDGGSGSTNSSWLPTSMLRRGL